MCVSDLEERKAPFTVICKTSAPAVCVEITKVLSCSPQAFSDQFSGICLYAAAISNTRHLSGRLI